jgi:methylmalonyl-CoA mutase
VQDCQLNDVNGFDSVTLYGNDPHVRPDIYGKIRMLEFQFVVWMMLKNYILVSICHAMTSVSMTINGPAPLLGFFMNAAIDQQCEFYHRK